jgi:MOSC domain-containing protein YiiM
MFTGIVEAIYIASAAEKPTQAVAAADAIPGVGLEGDRYARKQGTFFKPGPDYELTLIEAEAIEALRREYKVELTAGEARRNVVTRDVPLNHLVGKEFMVGEVRVRGIRLCEPCEHLQRLTGRQVIEGLRHRGGLRAQILTQGTIHAGDKVSERDSR